MSSHHTPHRIFLMYLYGFRWFEGGEPDIPTITEEIHTLLKEYGFPIHEGTSLSVSGDVNHISIEISGKWNMVFTYRRGDTRYDPPGDTVCPSCKTKVLESKDTPVTCPLCLHMLKWDERGGGVESLTYGSDEAYAKGMTTIGAMGSPSHMVEGIKHLSATTQRISQGIEGKPTGKGWKRRMRQAKRSKR